MVIHPPIATQIGSEIQISARIDFRKKPKNYPATLWFRFPKLFSNQISVSSEPFAVALLLLAMQKREPLQIVGSISRKLYTGLLEYQKIYHAWFPERFHLVEIQANPGEKQDSIPLEGITPNSGIACAFSGGVDSFYTLLDLSGRLDKDSTQKITHALFMAGFDMPLNLKASIQQLTQSYALLMKSLGVSFVVGSTNIRNFVNTVDWTNAHGQALVASALFFGRTWKQFLIPSSYTMRTHPKWGTHPLLDPLLSTETLEFIHHGAHANRLEKLTALIQFPMTYERLRVCWVQDIGLKNCGRCEKCMRTRIALEILDGLHHYTTFHTATSESRISRQEIRNLAQRTHQARLFARELMWQSFRRKKYQLFFDLAVSLIKRKIFYSLKKFSPSQRPFTNSFFQQRLP